MTTGENAFFDLLFQVEPPNPAQFQTVFESVMTTPSLTKTSEGIQQKLFLDFNDIADRLKFFLSNLNCGQVKKSSKKIADEIILNILQPIISDSLTELVSSETVIEVLLSGLPSVLDCSGSTQETLLKELSEADGLLEPLIADPKSSRAVKDWIKNHEYSSRAASILRRFTQRLMTLCDTCTHDHGTNTLSEQWQDLLKLTDSLEQHRLTYEHDQTIINSRDTRHLGGWRLLENDKKTGKGQQGLSTSAPQVSVEVPHSLHHFGILSPTSLRTTDNALDQLKIDVTFELLSSAMETFPCRPCTESACNPAEIHHRSFPIEINRPQLTDRSFDPEIFGRRIGVWKVLLSKQAVKDMRNLSNSGMIKILHQVSTPGPHLLTELEGISEILKDKLLDLVNGRWKKQGLEVGSGQQRNHLRVPIYRIKCVRNLWILWQIEIGVYDDLAVVKQAVKVWGIVKPDELPDAINKIISIQRLYGPVLVERCKTKPHSNSDGDFIPQQFPLANDPAQSVPSGDGGIVAQIDDDLMDMSNKSYALTEPFLEAFLKGDETLEYPFELSHEELSIVSHFETSAFILGRSGTGKTTCLIYKILLSFMMTMSLPGNNAIHQLLLTRSPHLSSKLRTFTRSLFEPHISTESSTGYLAMGQTLLDADAEMLETDTIFSARSASFPLICTFDWFLGLLENTIRLSNRTYFGGSGGSTGSSSHSRKPREVDFYTFKTEYWDRFPRSLTKKVSLELIFAEIMGVIKGSISSADTLAPLSREQYLDTSCRIAPTFTACAEREKVYMIYEHYENLKRDIGDIDQIDRVIAMLQAIKTTSGLSKKLQQAFDQVYIDEVQDHRCLDIALLLHLVKDARGFHLAGDTAQCISKDSTFRFAEIKDLFYQRYASISHATKQDGLAKPQVFALSKNYRSHSGILELASFVMKLLWTGFPNTVDKLDPEYSLLGGQKPLMFVGFEEDLLSPRMVGFGSLNDSFCDFGAEQVILVRDEEAKAKLKSDMGDSALILTILESKGMEFDDVVLYNFFSSSSHSASYRCLHLLVDTEAGKFDVTKHAALCHELKHLYVAVTRARKQLWLVEGLEQTTIPVLDVLNVQESLVEVVKPTDKDVEAKIMILRKGGLVDPSRWIQRGNQFLQRMNFESAETCFKKAADDQGLTTVRAFLREQAASNCMAKNNHDDFIKESEAAVELFLQVQLISNASKCLEGIEKYDKAAYLWYDRMNYLKAAELFELAYLFEKASECYHLTDNFSKAAEMLRMGNLYDQLITYLNENRDHIEPNSCRKYGRLCNLLLKQGRVSPDHRALCIELLGSNEEKEQFFKEFEMVDHLVEFYKSQGRSVELFQLLIENGQLEPAVDVAAANKFHDRIQEREIKTVFNLLQAEKLLWGMENGSDPFLVPRKWNGNLPPYLLSVSTAWNTLSHILCSVKRGETFGTLAKVQNEIVKECLCIYIVAFLPDHIIQTKSISDLPIEVIKVVVDVVNNLLSEKHESYSQSLYLVCGILKTPSHKELYLPWSPLRKASTIYQSTQKLAMEWILNRLSLAVTAFDERARYIWTLEWPEPCLYFLSSRPCFKNQSSNECSFSHKNRTKEECVSILKGLCSVASVFVAMSRLYLTRVMDNGFQRNFLSRRRFWLEKLIRGITYISAVDQTSSAVIEAISALQPKQAYFTVSIGLEELLFHRIGREWQDRSSLSSLLGQYELSLILGNGLNDRFLRAIRRKIYSCLIPSQPHPLRIARQAIDSFHGIQTAIFESDYDHFHNNLRDFLGSFSPTNSEALSEFHAVVGSFEYIATFLLCARRPIQSIVIPWSWATLHLVPILQSDSLELVVGTEEERSKYSKLLFELVFCFSRLLEHLDQNITEGSFYFSFSGRRLTITSSLMQRRNMELLAVIALNMGSDRVRDQDFGRMWEYIRKVFRLRSSPVGFLDQNRFDIFVHNFVPSYDIYGGKDRLYIIEFDENQSHTRYIGQALTRGAYRCTLKELQPAKSSDNTRRSLTSNNTTASHSSELIDHEAQVRKIQYFWRKHWPRVLDARRWNQSPQGSTIVSYLDLVASCVPKDDPSRSLMAIRSQFLTKGIELQLRLDTTTQKLQSLRKVSSDLFADSTLPPSRLEALQESWCSFLIYESTTERLRKSWSTDSLRAQHWWFDPTELEKALTNGLEEIGLVQEQLDTLDLV